MPGRVKRQLRIDWHVNGKIEGKNLTAYLLLDLVISYLFFHAALAFVLLLPGYLIFREHMQKKAQAEQLRQRRKEFLASLQYAQTALASGCSMENAMTEALREVRKIYAKDSFIVEELSRIVRGMHLNEPLERLLTEFGKRSGVEEIVEFAEVFAIARVCGGDLTRIMQNAVEGLQQREEVRQEIETILAGKQLEQTMMSVIPIMILAYVTLTSPGFMDPMYQSAVGILIMGVSLAVYLAAYLMGSKIMRITE